MSKELIVSSTVHETKVAILEDDEVVEVFFEREKQYGLAGSIYKGRVTRVLPGMQSAFVNIGLDRDAFLYVSDFFEDNEEYDRIVTTVEDKIVRMEEKTEVTPASTSTEVNGTGAPTGQPVEENGDAAPETGAAQSVSSSRPADSGDRWQEGRRGRRGRRRRIPPGRGFPESKYVSPVEAPSPPVAAVAESLPEPGSAFEVLPGESLAKYSRPSSQAHPAPALDVAEEAEEPLEDLRLSNLLDQTIPDTETGAVPSEEVIPPVESESQPEPVEAFAKPEAEEPPPAAEAETQQSQTETEQAQATPAPESEKEASVRERPFGRRYLHRNSRRMRRRGKDRRMPERGPEPAAAEEGSTSARTAGTSITDLLKEGQEIIVQIAKEPIGKKGARITSHIALPGRYLVYMPTVDHVGVSRKIVSDEERLRLKRIVQTHRVGMPGGFIVRTAGDGLSEEEIRSDMHFLYNLWLDLRQTAERKPAPALIHHDLGLVERILRDQLTDTFKTIWVDAQEDYERILQFVERFQPALVNRVKLYTRSNPIFDEFGITPELEKALRPKVWLKSGGYIVINQTEALVAIDVNTGKYVGKSNRLEDTIVKTNMDAIKEIVRQIRLRDLGGIIVVDFIDMDERKNRQKVMQALDDALRKDRSPSKILQFNDFGLVAITRKRVKQSLERTLCSPCPYCDGSGYVKSVTTMVQEILVEAKKIARNLDGRDVTLRMNPEVARVLKSRENAYLEEIESILGRPVLVKGDALLNQERFDFN